MTQHAPARCQHAAAPPAPPATRGGEAFHTDENAAPGGASQKPRVPLPTRPHRRERTSLPDPPPGGGEQRGPPSVDTVIAIGGKEFRRSCKYCQHSEVSRPVDTPGAAGSWGNAAAGGAGDRRRERGAGNRILELLTSRLCSCAPPLSRAPRCCCCCFSRRRRRQHHRPQAASS